MSELTAETFTRHGMPEKQATALVQTILERHRAPDQLRLTVDAGINAFIARELCEQIRCGFGSIAALVQWGMEIDLAKAIAEAISNHSPWRMRAGPEKAA